MTLAPGVSWQWQLQGTLDTTVNVSLYDVDLFDTPGATIASLHARGKKVVCYVNAGAAENWRPDFLSLQPFTKNALSGWTGEWWLDTRAPAVRTVMLARLGLAKAKGCDGIEPDNIDGYSNNSGFPLDAATQLDYNRFIAASAHSLGLAVALKNDLDQVTDLVGDFDFALVEECVVYKECDKAKPFVSAGKAVLAVEYGDQNTEKAACPTLNSLDFDGLVKNLSLDAFRIPCR